MTIHAIATLPANAVGMRRMAETAAADTWLSLWASGAIGDSGRSNTLLRLIEAGKVRRVRRGLYLIKPTSDNTAAATFDTALTAGTIVWITHDGAPAAAPTRAARRGVDITVVRRMLAEGRPVGEIADHFGVAYGTVRWAMERAGIRSTHTGARAPGRMMPALHRESTGR